MGIYTCILVGVYMYIRLVDIPGAKNHRSLLQNIVSFIGLFCKKYRSLLQNIDCFIGPFCKRLVDIPVAANISI